MPKHCAFMALAKTYIQNRTTKSHVNVFNSNIDQKLGTTVQYRSLSNEQRALDTRAIKHVIDGIISLTSAILVRNCLEKIMKGFSDNLNLFMRLLTAAVSLNF